MSETPEEQGDNTLSPDEARQIIHSHRKVRYGTACWPCRQRKVKCDNKQPCENCVRRDHAGLCSYDPKQRPPKTGSGLAAGGVKRKYSPESESSSKREEDRWPRNHDEDATESRYIGQNSIAALLSEEVQAQETSGDGEHTVIHEDIMPILGLQPSSAPYPFMSPEHMDKIRHDIAKSLPSDKDVLKTFQIYKQIVQPFWGLLIDIEDFESKLCVYLEERTASVSKAGTTIKGVSSAWLGILFAVLGVATNYSEESYAKRSAMSRAYVESSFHCLRLSNFLVRPSIDSLQAMLNLEFVLANDMKAEASWAMVGLVCRFAQSLGLHRGPHEHNRIPGAKENDLPRRKLWWTIVWQDSLVSLSFDRSPIATMTRCEIPLGPTALTEGFTYTEAVYHICRKIMESVKMDTPTTADFAQIVKDCADVEHIRTQVRPSLRTKEACKSVQDRLQHFALILHTSFVVSALCRPALRRGESIGMDFAQKSILAKRCKQNLTETVRHYLKMHKLSVIPTRSWAFTYHGLSSAVLLGILGETKTDPEVRQLQGDLIAALSVTAAKQQPSSQSSKDKDIELSGPLSRALTALKHIYDHGWVAETKTESQPIPTQQVPPSFEQQDAALAMASMQHGTILPPMGYQQQPLPSGMSSVQAVNRGQNASMSPMDLFDSIFWEPYPNQVNDGLAYDYTIPSLYQPF